MIYVGFQGIAEQTVKQINTCNAHELFQQMATRVPFV